MIYNQERTSEIVERLVLLGNNLRAATITINAVNFTVLLGILGALIFGPLWFIFAILGLIIGIVVGYFMAGALATMLEWMAQVLISLQPPEGR